MPRLESLKLAVQKALPDLDLVLGWRQGLDPLRTAPYLIKTEQDLEHLVFNRLCVNNLSSQLMHWRGKRVGIMVKGCDSRSVAELLQEKLISRESVKVFGLPCTGVVDLKKIAQAVDPERVDEVKITKDSLELRAGQDNFSLPLSQVLADKCLACAYPNPVVFDEMIGEPVEPWAAVEAPQQAAFRAMSLPGRFAFWLEQMDRCIRCYGCRNSCPMCFCKDVCLADSRDPRWQSQETSVREKWMFQLIHAMHLAGRCTACGECERACPVGIPLMTMKRELNAITHELFQYEAGLNPEAIPPLLTFKTIEENIKESA